MNRAILRMIERLDLEGFKRDTPEIDRKKKTTQFRYFTYMQAYGIHLSTRNLITFILFFIDMRAYKFPTIT